ncbi:MAG: fibronectin type III domain-containing protein [Anaerovoracaceae bacterium]
MTKLKKIISGMLTFAFLTTVMFASVSSAFALENWSTIRTDISKVMLAPGADESQLNFAWYSTENAVPAVQIVKYNEEFGDAGLFSGTSSTAYRNAETGTQYYANKVTATGLEPETEYKYRYKTGDGEWSETYDYYTQSIGDGFGFIAIGDVQIGVGNGGSEADTERWENTLDLAIEKMPYASFIMSMGDQVDSNKEEDQYAGFMYPEILRNVPISTIAGDQDCDDPNLTWHFNNPNQTKYGETNAGGDYYYSYGNLLVISLNSNAVLKSEKSSNVIAYEHRKCIEEAIASNPYAKWRVVTFHHDIYGYPDHYENEEVTKCREQLYPIIDAYDIDVVLTGHGHNYTRSYQMENNSAVKADDVDYNASDVTVQNPDGTVYFELSTPASKNFENNKPGYLNHIAKSFAVNMVQSYSCVTVTSESFTIETYRTDTNEGYDSYTIIKSDRAKLDQSISKAERMIASGEYSGEKLENLKAALDEAKDVRSKTAENGELEKAYDAAAILDEAIGELNVLWKDITAPVISGIEDGKNYCSAQTVSVTDNVFIQNVTVNGSVIDLVNNQFTLSPVSGAQEIIATDNAGNRTKVTVTVNDGHIYGAWQSNGNGTHTHKCTVNDCTGYEDGTCEGGTATCISKAICAYCGSEYGNYFYFKNTTGWEDVYVYWWGSEEACPAFPGIKTTPVAGRDGFYYVELPEDATGLNFNNGKAATEGGQQTDSITGDNLIIGNIFIPDPDDSFEKNGGLRFRGVSEKYVNNHAGKKEWTRTETQHEQKWNCCGAIEVPLEDHSWSDGVCSECDYICAHKDENKDNKCDVCKTTLSGNTGGVYIPLVQKPTIQSGEGLQVTLSADGKTATITVDDGYEIADVVLNGVSLGKVTEVESLKTGDKLVVTAVKKAEEPTKEEILAALADQQLTARSKLVTMKNGKKAIKLTWTCDSDVDFDGVEIYRSTKRYSGYGKKPIYTTTKDAYYNTAIKKGTKYYYKVRGYVTIDGEKVYTDWSTKAWRTVQ